MTKDHLAEVVYQAPGAAGRTFLLDRAGDIPDPIGTGLGVYRQTAKRIRDAIQARLSEIVR